MTWGRFRGMLYGAGLEGYRAQIGQTNYDIKAENAGWCARFTALTTKDIKSVCLRWSSVTVGTGVMTLRIETIDATTGKPTGDLYDANAVIESITPVSGSVTTHTFATLPTTGFTLGTEYGVVLLTTAAFTAATLFSSCTFITGGFYPYEVLTAADGTTRSNFAEVSNAPPIIAFILDDDTIETMGCHGYYQSNYLLYGTRAFASKIVVHHTITIAGILGGYHSKIGTPAGDLRARVFDASDNVIANTTRVIDKDSILTISGSKEVFFGFDSIVTLIPGTYRIVVDSADSANSSNCWNMFYGTPLNSGLTTNLVTVSKISTTTDVTATPIVWTDGSGGELGPFNFILDDLISPITPSFNLGI